MNDLTKMLDTMWPPSSDPRVVWKEGRRWKCPTCNAYSVARETLTTVRYYPDGEQTTDKEQRVRCMDCGEDAEL